MKREPNFTIDEPEERTLTPMEEHARSLQKMRLKFELMLEIQSLVQIVTSEDSDEAEVAVANYALEAIAEANEYYENISA